MNTNQLSELRLNMDEDISLSVRLPYREFMVPYGEMISQVVSCTNGSDEVVSGQERLLT